MKKQKLGKKYILDWNEPTGWYKRFIRQETRLFLKRELEKEMKESSDEMEGEE